MSPPFFQLVPYLFLSSFFSVFKPFSLGTSSSCVPSQSSNDCFETSMPISSVIRNLLVYEESLQWVALPYAFHFVHNPSWKNLLPLLIHHKLWKGDPSIVQAHKDPSLLQLRYDLPIPLTHTPLNSISSIVRNVRVAAKLLDNQRLSPFGNLIQLLLAEHNLVEQAGQVQLGTGGQETFLCLFWNILPCQYSGTRCLCVVVPLVRTGTDEGGPPSMAEADEMSGRGLTPVVGMERDHMPWLPAKTGLHCRNHLDLYVRADGPCLGPSGGTVRDREGPAEGSHGLPSPRPTRSAARTPGMGRKEPIHVCTGILPPRRMLRV